MANREIETEVLNRLRTVKGHIAGIERMVEEGQSCRDILVQLSAIRAAVEKIGVYILEQNALDCLCADLDSKADKQKVQEIVKQMLTFLK